MGWKEKNAIFGYQKIPYYGNTTHFCFIGATGSGKTVNIRIMMQSVLPDVGQGHGVRALVYDSKREMIPIIRGMFSASKRDKLIIPLNPSDKRSYAWAMCEDIDEPLHAQEMANILVPKSERESQPFFSNAVRSLLEGVMTAFIKKRQRNGIVWTFRDVMNAMWSRDDLIALLRSEPYTAGLVPLFFSHDKTAENIMSEVATKLGPYRIVASLWHHAKREGREISLRGWLKEEERILVLGNDHTNRAAIDAINQVLFKRITQLILDEKDIKVHEESKRTWVFLDEFARAGKLDGAVELTTEGRSKGACVVLGFQDINGLRAVYGREVAEEIIGQCSNFAVLRLQSPDTAEWASKFFGNYRGMEKAISESSGTAWTPQGTSTNVGTTINQQVQERAAVLTSQFMHIRPVGEETDVGINGYFFSPYFDGGNRSAPRGSGTVKFIKVPWAYIFQGEEKNLWDSDKNASGVERRHSDQQYLLDWEEEDYKRLDMPYSPHKAELRKLKEAERVRNECVVEFAELARFRELTKEELKVIEGFSPEERQLFLKVSRKGDRGQGITGQDDEGGLKKTVKRIMKIRKVSRDADSH